MVAPIDEGLAIYDVPRVMVEPLLRSLRMVNTAADAVFYDVCALWRQLFARGVVVSTEIAAARAPQPAQMAAFRAMAEHVVNLSALTDPEGVIPRRRSWRPAVRLLSCCVPRRRRRCAGR